MKRNKEQPQVTLIEGRTLVLDQLSSKRYKHVAQWKYLKLGRKFGAPATCSAKQAKLVSEYENRKNKEDMVAKVFKFGRNINN